MRVVLTVIVWSLLMCSTATAAAKITHGDQIQLQATMKKEINKRTVDGKFTYFDTKRDAYVSLYPAKSHKMILKMGENYILCADFRDENGKKVSIDFYVARKENEFTVIDTVVNNRNPIRRMMKKGVAVVAK